MSQEIPVQALAAIATLVAALIAGAISFVSLTMTKEQKTSEFRQAWIDALREDLSTFFACARAFARATEERHILGPNYKDQVSFPISDERVSDIRFQIAEVHYRIKLRLNSEEAEHKELMRLMVGAIVEQNKMIQQRGTSDATLKALELAADYASPILKKEWRRVKEGERPFRIARNWMAPAIVLVSVGFIVLIWTGTFKI
ncbi:hypothetical protein GJ697_11895 [Pseudoduganella sp. FT25W]|jgi:hypothetical protein|uniref:Uncharacterized protein n=1 Tax=Duganella alba TaxID=2666081 RepID=A0A6L5QHV2_9BURK|nr:hypothetical protein [Duganella alba]MRX08541.1 hypothetical protein [Duganella alba]MRX16985.1 hypothetical protein [Duganella alba]